MLSRRPPAATIQLPPVTVTAQKEPADPRTLPVSVTAVPQVDADRTPGVGIVSEAGQYSPNTYFTEFTARKLSNARFRGIGSSPANPGVTTYFDGVPQLNANTSSIDLLDVEQVEFVRGPQSALFGRNTLGGLSTSSSARPSLSAWTGSCLGAIRQRELDGDCAPAPAGPLVSGRLGASFAMVYGQRDGYTTNVDHRQRSRLARGVCRQGRSCCGRRRPRGRRASSSTASARATATMRLNDLGGLRDRPVHGRARLRGLHPSRPVRDHDPQPPRRRRAFAVTATTGLLSWNTEDATDLDYTPLPLLRAQQRRRGVPVHAGGARGLGGQRARTALGLDGPALAGRRVLLHAELRTERGEQLRAVRAVALRAVSRRAAVPAGRRSTTSASACSARARWSSARSVDLTAGLRVRPRAEGGAC